MARQVGCVIRFVLCLRAAADVLIVHVAACTLFVGASWALLLLLLLHC